MYANLKTKLEKEIADIKSAGLYKQERVIASSQDAVIKLEEGSEVINFCANNYLGLSSHPKVIAAAHAAIDDRGYGMSSVRFILRNARHSQTAGKEDFRISGNGRHHFVCCSI